MSERLLVEKYPCRRRCWWCGVVLRWWQLNSCRRCSPNTRGSAPCPQRARWDEWPDRRATDAGQGGGS